MKRLALLFATLAAAALTLACSSDSAPETPSVTPSASQATAAATTAPTTAVQPTTAPTVAVQPTTAPTVAVQPTQPPAAATQPPAPQPTSPPAPSGPVTIAVSATNLAFDRTSISVPRNATVTVNFTNNDVLVAHDFGVSIPFVPHTETCNGSCQASIAFNSGPPGAYTFQCSTHAEMVGAFTVN